MSSDIPKKSGTWHSPDTYIRSKRKARRLRRRKRRAAIRSGDIRVI
jgi:hypothetical protein